MAEPPAGSPAAGAPKQSPAAARTIYRVGEAEARGPAAPQGWATRRLLPALRVALSLPLVYFAAVSAGLALYMLYLLGGHAKDEPGHLTLGLVVAAAAAVCALALLGYASVLRERPRHRLWLWTCAASGLGAVLAGAALALGMETFPAACAAAVLFYTAVAAAICGVIGAYGLDAGRPVDRVAGRPWYGWLWRTLVALVAVVLAAGAAALAFSLAAASFVPAQAEFALGSSIWQQVTARSGAGLVGGVLAVVAANAGVAALFGLLVHVAVRTLGWWRGRLHAWWLAAAGVTVVLGVIAWILDSSLPRW